MARNLSQPLATSKFDKKSHPKKKKKFQRRTGITTEGIGGGKKDIDKIWNKANAEYLEKGSKHESKIKAKAQKKVDKAVSYNKSRSNYLKHAAKISQNTNQSKQKTIGKVKKEKHTLKYPIFHSSRKTKN